MISLNLPTGRGCLLPSALLPMAIALSLTACGGGGGVRATPPPVIPTTPPPPTGIGFTPNVANDSTLTQLNPPAIPTQGSPVTLTDPSINRHLTLTNAMGALGAGLKGQGVGIGIIDSGVSRTHPALSGRVTQSFIHVSASNNLAVDDSVGHGTTVASLAAGRPAPGLYSGGETGNWGGGIAQESTILSSRIIADTRPIDDGSGQGNAIAAGQGYGDFFKSINAELANAGARVLNNSWGGLYWSDPALTTELANAWKDFVVTRGGIVVFANGNSGRDSRFVGEPSDNARLPTLANDPQLEKGWITVGALDPVNPTQLTDYSQQCGSAKNYCLVAPGNVVFIDPKATSAATSALFQGGGTSYAAPLVSGALAVVWSAFPYFNNDQVRQTVLGAAKDLGAPGVDSVFGWGLLDVSKAANGPSNFAWGNFDVTLSQASVWRNVIDSPRTGLIGGLIKRGTGILTITEKPKYWGDTNVVAGGLSLPKGLEFSTLVVGAGATVWTGGDHGRSCAGELICAGGPSPKYIGGRVSNNGTLLIAASPAGITFYSDFVQSATGNLGVWLGNPLRILGTATLNGQMSILGVKSGYTTTAKETLLNATAGVSGIFSTLRAAPNVFLDASLSYDPNNVFLNINRIDVASAVMGLGLSAATVASAQRVESAMSAIDGQLSGALPAGISGAFIDAAGDLQRASSIARADFALRSLSGGLHAASSALTFDAIDTGRRALDTRIDRLAQAPQAIGGWFRDLSSSGTLAQAGYDGIGMDSAGEMIGNDWRLGRNAVFGVAMNKVRQSSWLGAFGDRSRGQQRELQLYAAGWRGQWHGQVHVSSGSFDRQLQRNLLLGTLQDAVAAQVSGRYESAYAEFGRRFDFAGLAVVPYAGSQVVRIHNDGFAERGGTGFGLRAEAWDSSRWQGLAGLRAERGWRVGNADLRADARAEWQQTLGSNGALFDASFTGVEQWSPLQGIGLAQRSQLFGLGLSAGFGGRSTFRFDLSRRASNVGNSSMASLQAMYRF